MVSVELAEVLFEVLAEVDNFGSLDVAVLEFLRGADIDDDGRLLSFEHLGGLGCGDVFDDEFIGVDEGGEKGEGSQDSNHVLSFIREFDLSTLRF